LLLGTNDAVDEVEETFVHVCVPVSVDGVIFAVIV
jgi:hypothetical protein